MPLECWKPWLRKCADVHAALIEKYRKEQALEQAIFTAP